jgi:hypothetical protein
VGKYRVIGAQEIEGAKKGETFEADFSAEKEWQLSEGGHIEVIKAGEQPEDGPRAEPRQQFVKRATSKKGVKKDG